MSKDFDAASAMIRNNFTEEEVVNLLRSLVAIESHKNVPDQERKVGEFIYGYLVRNGFQAVKQKVTEERFNVIGKMKGAGNGKTLLLNGHLDTVPPYEMDFDPFAARVENGIVFGRGTVDMKGAIACMLMSMVTLKRSGVKLKGDLIFAGTVGEEGPGEGMEKFVLEPVQADGAMVGEPSNFEYAIGHRGLEWIEIEVIGKGAHGGTPELGVNAIVKAARLIVNLEEKIGRNLPQKFHPHMGPAVMNIGFIKGGTQPSTVADRCIIQLDRRYIPGETVETVVQEIQDVVDEMAASDPQFKANISRMPENLMEFHDHVPLVTPENSPFVDSVKNVLRYINGQSEPTLTTRRGWTDAAMLGHYAKIPSVVCGPGDIRYSHSRNEQMKVSDLLKGVELYSLVALDFCRS